MSRITTIEEFLRNYLKDAPEYGAKTYDEYAKEVGADYEGEYARSLRDAMTKKRRSAPSYGTTGQSLVSKGLSGTGYADFLTDKAMAVYAKDVESAEGSLATGRSGLLRGYRDYLESYSNDRAALRARVQKQLIDNEVYDKNSSYLYGIDAGLSPEEATAVSGTVYSAVRGRLRRQIIDRVTALELDAEGARLYALSMGLTAEDAKSIAEEAKDYLKHYKDYADGYWDYLENQNKGQITPPSWNDFKSWYTESGNAAGKTDQQVLDEYNKYLEYLKKLENGSVGIYK